MNNQKKNKKNKIIVITLMNNYYQKHTLEDKILFFLKISYLKDQVKDNFQKEVHSNKMI